jgi:hypothetical protein
MWTFVQSNGQLLNSTATLVGIGYAGNGAGKNNPAMQNVHNVGPLPVGIYGVGAPVNHTHLGPNAIPLIPDPANEMFGRSEFYCHAERIQPPPGLASDGCIVMEPESVRMWLAASGEKLQVISGLPLADAEQVESLFDTGHST